MMLTLALGSMGQSPTHFQAQGVISKPMTTQEPKRMTADEIVKWFEADGWKRFQAHYKIQPVISFYKSFADIPKCECNKPKSKQVEAYVSSHAGFASVEIECCGELKTGQWAKAHIWGFTPTADQIQLAIETAKRQWTLIAQ